VWSDRFYIGAGRREDYQLRGQVFADNLPTPQEFTLTITADVQQTSLTVKELTSLRD
jgi:hypothetical protein